MSALNFWSLGTGTGITAVDATSFATASVTSTTGRVAILVAAARRAAGEPNNPTASGHSLTWTRLTSVYAGAVKLSVFTAPITAGATGAITVDYGGQTQDTHAYAIVECNSDTAGAIVQSITGSVAAGTTFTLTLSGAFASAENGVFVALAADSNNSGLRPEQGYHVPVASNAATMALPQRDAEGLALTVAWRPDNDAACVVTLNSANGVGIMAEIDNPNAAAGGGGASLSIPTFRV